MNQVTVMMYHYVRELKKTRDFLCSIDVDSSDWGTCYPYGGYNSSLIEILKKEK